MKKALAVSLMLVSTSVFSVPNLYAPGEINPNVTQENIHKTVCVVGWTSTVRPSTTYTNRLKKKHIIQYGYSDKNLRSYEFT